MVWVLGQSPNIPNSVGKQPRTWKTHTGTKQPRTWKTHVQAHVGHGEAAVNVDEGTGEDDAAWAAGEDGGQGGIEGA